MIGRSPWEFLHDDAIGGLIMAMYDLVGQGIVILTASSGAHRVYAAKEVTFSKWDRKGAVVDQQGQTWKVTENAPPGPAGQQLDRLAAPRAFWFG